MTTQTITETAQLTTGQNVSTTSTIPTFSEDGMIEFDHTVDIGASGSEQINVALVIDTSGSTSNLSGSDVDGDGTIDTYLQAQVIAAKALFQNYIDLGYDPSRIQITLVEYNDGSNVINYSDGGVTRSYFTLDDQTEFDAALDGLSPGGFTNFAAGLNAVDTAWTGQGVDSTESNAVVFMSDGRQNVGGAFNDEAQDLINTFGANISGIGVGTNASLTAGTNGGLNDLDNTGGAEIVSNPADLIATINTPPPNVDVDSVTVDFSFEDPNNPGTFLSYSETYTVGAPGSPLVATPTGYAISNQNIDLDPDPMPGTQINMTLTTSFENGQTSISTGMIVIPAVVCFAGTTRILTDQGEVEAQDLKVGDRVFTLDNGFQSLKWIGVRKLSVAVMKSMPNLRPIKISAGALGAQTPSRDLYVSRQHRVLVAAEVARRMFGVREILVPALRLVDLPGVEVVEPKAPLAYVHFSFSHHQIVVSEGAFTESLYIGPQTLAVMTDEQRAELRALFPELVSGAEKEVPARFIPDAARQKTLVARLARNHKSPRVFEQHPTL